MAQAENRAPTTTFTPVRMDEVLWASRSEVLRADPSYSVDIDLIDVEDESQLTVNGNENLLRSLITNLIENACKYGASPAGVVTRS